MLSFLGVLCYALHGTIGDPLVHSPWGQIQGVQDVTTDMTPYHAYYAIPYALPPTGVRRFTKPVQHTGFNTYVFNASSPGPICTQIKLSGLKFGFSMSEDCLTLDVFTPVTSSISANIPVIVYIHGGGFIFGSSIAFPGGPLAAKGVVLVMIQYRLGPFGFLSTGDDSSRGNYGLWDQHMALQWVNKNIQAFGGDVNKITLMGESAGSASVAYQTLYGGSKGLFQRTIMQSGSATSTWALNRNPVKTTYELSKKVGCPTANVDNAAVVKCLRAVPADDMAKAFWPLGPDPVEAMTGFFFVPTVDGEFVKDEPMTLMNSPKYLRDVGVPDRDCMVSVVSNEGGLLLSQTWMTDQALGSSWSTALVNRTFYRDRLIPHLLDLYFGNSSSNMVDVVDFELTYPDTHFPIINLQKVLDTSADPSIVVPTVSFAMAHADMNSTKGTYMFVFDHTPTFIPHVVQGALHGDDNSYTFGLEGKFQLLANVSSISPTEKKISNTLMSLITEFARKGNPNQAVKNIIGKDWPQFTAANQEYLDLGTNPSVMSYPFRRRFALWTELLPELLKASGPKHANGPVLPNPIG